MIATLLLSLGVTFGPEQAVPPGGTQTQLQSKGGVQVYTDANRVMRQDGGGPAQQVSWSGFIGDHPTIDEFPDGSVVTAHHLRYSTACGSANGGMMVFVEMPGVGSLCISGTTQTAFDPSVVALPDGSAVVVYTYSFGMRTAYTRVQADGSILPWERDVLVSEGNNKHHHPNAVWVDPAGPKPGFVRVFWEAHTGASYPEIRERDLHITGQGIVMDPVRVVGGSQAYNPFGEVQARGFQAVIWQETGGRIYSALLTPGGFVLSVTDHGFGSSYRIAFVGNQVVPAIVKAGILTVGSESFPAEKVTFWDGKALGYDRSGRAYWRETL